MAITAGSSLNSVPAPQQQTLNTNYLDFTGTTDTTWAQQYLPDLMEKEAEVFGPRTISGFLSQVGAEEAMQSDRVVWSEQGRLHLSYKGNINSASAGADPGGGSGTVPQFTCETDIDGNAVTTTHGIRVNDTVLVSNANGVYKCLVTVVAGAVVDLITYDASVIAALATSGATTLLVYGSEFGKGDEYRAAAGTSNTTSVRGSNEPQIQTFQNKPIIIKDYYDVSGSDTARIGWVEVAAEDGTSGYLWYLKAEAETRLRFTDHLEMAMLENEMNAAGSNADGATIIAGSAAGGANRVGTEGLWSAIETRGNQSSGITGVNAATDLAEFDAILAEFDNQGAIEENMMFVNRATSLAVDDMLASMNSYGAGGTSYGVFNNSEDMALNLGFSGFRRGSYDFYK